MSDSAEIASAKITPGRDEADFGDLNAGVESELLRAPVEGDFIAEEAAELEFPPAITEIITSPLAISRAFTQVPSEVVAAVLALEVDILEARNGHTQELDALRKKLDEDAPRAKDHPEKLSVEEITRLRTLLQEHHPFVIKFINRFQSVHDLARDLPNIIIERDQALYDRDMMLDRASVLENELAATHELLIEAIERAQELGHENDDAATMALNVEGQLDGKTAALEGSERRNGLLAEQLADARSIIREALTREGALLERVREIDHQQAESRRLKDAISVPERKPAGLGAKIRQMIQSLLDL